MSNEEKINEEKYACRRKIKRVLVNRKNNVKNVKKKKGREIVNKTFFPQKSKLKRKKYE